MNYYDREEWPAFLAAIRAAPDDDLPRLVVADWLEENGEPERAEFIRVQVERASNPDRAACDRCRRDWSRINKSSFPVPMSYCENCRTDGPFWPDAKRSLSLRGREMELLAMHGHSWGGVGLIHRGKIGPLFHNENGEDPRPICRWERGFLSRVSAPLAVLHGADCSLCSGTGRFRIVDNFFTHCTACNGTGRVPGVLAELLRREPLTAAGIEITESV